MIPLKQIKDKLPYLDSYSHKDNIITVRKGFFYTMGQTTDDYIKKVKKFFPDANIIDSGEVWKTFRGGTSVANQSHWFVKFSLPE